jgi:hypothetical protein
MRSADVPRWRSWLVVYLLAVVPLLALACHGGSPPSTTAVERDDLPPELAGVSFFEDVTAASGIDFTYRNGEDADHFSLLESLGGGVALLDYDGDGLLDILVTGGGDFTGPERRLITGHPSRLYRNLGNGHFRDVTAEVGLDRPLFYTHGCAVADYDCDGWPDLLVTGWGRLALYHNESDGKGGRRFVEVTQQAGLHDRLWSTSAAWADLDGDGYPDLYICHYVDWSLSHNLPCKGDVAAVERDVCPPKTFTALPHLLYRNNRDGTFTDVSKSAGLRQHTAADGMGLGVLVVDVNDDRRPDVYVANDTEDNFLYLNRSTPGKIELEEKGLESGVARSNAGRPDGSMGVDAADYDGCGRPSLWVTTFEKERHQLHHNDCQPGQMAFTYATWRAGIAALGPNYVGFGTGFLDVDNRGWEDIVIANGHVRRHPTRAPLRQRPILLHNEGNGTFRNATPAGGPYFQTDHRGRGLAIGDLDNDGRLDLVISHLNEPVVVLRNRGEAANGAKNHWLGIELHGRKNRDIVGARVVVEVGQRWLTRFAKGGGSYLSSGDRRHLFGLGETEKVGRVSVLWPWGEEQHWEGLSVDRYWRLTEGEAAPQELPSRNSATPGLPVSP